VPSAVVLVIIAFWAFGLGYLAGYQHWGVRAQLLEEEGRKLRWMVAALVKQLVCDYRQAREEGNIEGHLEEDIAALL